MTIVWTFSTHPKSNYNNGRSVVNWVSDRKLEENIKSLLQLDPDANAEFLARRFLMQFDLEPLALNHMSAYLAKLGYRAANRVHDQLSKFQQYSQLQIDKRDVWQIAWLFSSKPAEFFETFDRRRPLENYACIKMEGRIKDEIFGNLGMGGRIYSDWGLIWRQSRKIFREALQQYGYVQPQLGRYLLAYDCFKEIYAPQTTGSRSLSAPTDKQFQDMAELYDRLVQPPHQAVCKVERATIEA